jgi:putative membrane-bound dehydrogenase-like protein
MFRMRFWTYLALVVGSSLFAGRTHAGGYTPEEARARMTLPEGFSARVFASEPMVRQPVSACFDERGRLWVVEYLQYPTPNGLKPVSADQYLRTEYDRCSAPPPLGYHGADRIKILEDTDGDGRADRAKTFLEGLNLASGLALGHGGVFVAQAPYLLFYPDRDRDDCPDGPPEVLLAGFGLQDAHAVLNSLTWGPDGWLYGAQGSTVTAHIEGLEFQQGIWRYHPITKRFELFAEGGGNTWGLDFDRAGNAFGSSNSGFIVFPMVQGGYYWKGFAKHGPLHNPHAFGYLNAIDYQGPKLGGHVTPGGIIYKADAFPAAFQGAFLGGNLLSNTVYWHPLSRKGSTFSARHGGTLLDARDTWFRPIDLLTGPDGSVYVVDWYDRRASHLDPRDNWDRTNGRIYAIDYHERRRVEPFDLAHKSSSELVDLRTSANDWYASEARRILAERRDSSIIPKLKQLLRDDKDEVIALRDLWALHVSGGLDDETALALLDHACAGVRRWTVRLLGDDRRTTPGIQEALIRLAATEPDPVVRSQLASSCQRWGPREALPILAKLILRSEDIKDLHIPLLLWWALERQMRIDREGVVDLIASSEAQASPLVREHLLERVARKLASDASEADFLACARLLSAATALANFDAIITGIEKGLEGRRLEEVPSPLKEPLRKLWERGRPDLRLVRCAVRLGSVDALREAETRAADHSLAEPDRIALIDLLGQAGAPEALETLRALLDYPDRPALALAVLNALGRFANPAVADVLLGHYPTLNRTLQDHALDLLCSRKAWASRLLDAVGQGRLSAKDLHSAHILMIVQFGDAQLNKTIERVWGRIPGPNSAAKAQRIAEVRGMLVEGDKGNPWRGQVVFRENCAGCHRLFGEGESIGPDLTGAERNNLEFLLSSVIDPSALVRKEYEAQTIALTDGRVLTGLVVEETDKAITLFDSKKQRTVLPRDTIEEMKPSATSLMPEGLLDTLREDQIRDLFKYLQSSGPPAPSR